jgi:hypothetical protein
MTVSISDTQSKRWRLLDHVGGIDTADFDRRTNRLRTRRQSLSANQTLIITNGRPKRHGDKSGHTLCRKKSLDLASITQNDDARIIAHFTNCNRELRREVRTPYFTVCGDELTPYFNLGIAKIPWMDNVDLLRHKTTGLTHIVYSQDCKYSIRKDDLSRLIRRQVEDFSQEKRFCLPLRFLVRLLGEPVPFIFRNH